MGVVSCGTTMLDQGVFQNIGAVSWDTTPKTATFTAVSGEGYFCNTSGGAFEVDLPAGVAGAIVSVQDYNNTFDTNNLTIDPNGSEKINGGDAGLAITLSTEGQGLTLVYVDATVGWRSVHSDDFSQVPQTPTFITATGGTITTVDTDYKVHTFTGPGTFTVCSVGNAAGSNTVSYMVIAGGGGGGGEEGGGGGAGGFREGKTPCTPYTASPLIAPAGLPVSAQAYPIVIGAGGIGIVCDSNPATSGSDSVFSSITSTGGGRGGDQIEPTKAGGSGGSGGGGSGQATSPGGTGNTPPVSPAQGTNGGNGICRSGTTNEAGGGGGGATVAGTAGSNSPNPGGGGGNGGAGATTSINGTPTTRAGGGGGGAAGSSGVVGSGGSGGGGAGTKNNTTATAGTTNTGSGGGGGGGNAGASGGARGGNGGSGITIIRYKFQ